MSKAFNKFRREEMQRALQEKPAIEHPLLSAIQFDQYTQQYGGATMDVKTNKVLEPGETDVVLVGGEKDTAGKRIPTTYYGKTRKGSGPKETRLSPAQILSEKARVMRATRGREGAMVGSYISEDEPHKGVQIDASAGVTDRSQVIPTLRARNEESAWDNKNQTLIMNPYYKPRGRKK